VNNDTALILMLVDRQRDIEALRERLAETEANLRECETERDIWQRRFGEASASARTFKADSPSSDSVSQSSAASSLDSAGQSET
jgi:phage shock protein A